MRDGSMVKWTDPNMLEITLITYVYRGRRYHYGRDALIVLAMHSIRSIIMLEKRIDQGPVDNEG